MDIETTGLSPHYDRMTVVGIYDGKKAKAFVRGIDLDDIVGEFAKYDFLVTYNDACFDLPFVKQECPKIEFNQMRTDLTYQLRRTGYTGSLKAIEQVLGIARGRDMAHGSRVLMRSGSGTSVNAAEVMRSNCC